MKSLRPIAALLLLTTLTACGEANSSADQYLKNHKTSDVKPAPTPTPTPNPNPTPAASTASVEAGNKLLESCAGCHTSSLFKLDATYLEKLENAATGSKAGNHTTVQKSFEGQNRKDLEAALALVK